MGTNLLLFFSCFTVALLAGCTNVSVLPYTGTEDGLHFSLPETFLLVTPKADGTVGYQWVYLPDQSHEYVVQQNSVLSKFTLDVQVQNGLLKQVGSSQDSSAIAAKVATDAGNVTNAYVQAMLTAHAAQAAPAASQKKGVAGGNVIGGNAMPPVPSLAYGPVLLRVTQDENGVALIPVEFNAKQGFFQPLFVTNQAAQTGGGQGAPTTVKLTCTDVTSTSATVTASQVIFAPKGSGTPTLHPVSGADVTLPKPSFTPTPTNNPTQTTIKLTFPSAITSGTYTITIPYNPSRGGTDADDISADAACTLK